MHDTEVFNNRRGWVREVTTNSDGSKYIVDSRLCPDGSMEYHEYNLSSDESEHTHVHGNHDHGTYYGHSFEERPWRW